MRSLLLVAHGSRREASNDEVRHLAAALAERCGTRFGAVECAFLEIAEPSISQSITSAVEAGADEILVLPYFLSAGRHVVQDIPFEVESKRREYPQVAIHIAPYLGLAAGLVDILSDLAEH